jgi:outer membrane protein assembly factor BamD
MQMKHVGKSFAATPATSLNNVRTGLYAVAKTLALSITLSFTLTACDTLSSINPFDRTEKYKPEIIPETPADKLYNDGLARMNTGDYAGAAKKFGDIDKQAPFSKWAQKALVLQVSAYYEDRQYDDVISTAKRYLGLHPSTPEAAYVHYLLAMSYFMQIPDVTRDQEKTELALKTMQEMIDRHPTSEYVRDGREKIQITRDQMAGKEVSIGNYYLKKRNYTGAINRYRDVVGKYQTTRHVEEALMRLTEAYMALGIINEAQTAAAILGHNFPNSPWYKDAYTLLQSRGLEPREDKGSWISRAFQQVVGLKL